MNCDKFQEYELGELTVDQFDEHMKNCSICRAHMQEDEKLLELAITLNKPIEAPQLWAKIEKSLRNEKKQYKSLYLNVFRQHQSAILRIAAVFLMVVGVSAYFYFTSTPQNTASKTNLLVNSALEKIEKKEQEYMNAIEELENVVLPQMAQMDTDSMLRYGDKLENIQKAQVNMNIMLRYRDKLETIDEQIAQCKEALSKNPANAHIRRYLFSALQDKKDTLQDLLEYQSSVM